MARVTGQDVAAVSAPDAVMTIAPRDDVVSVTAPDLVAALGADQDIITLCADDVILVPVIFFFLDMN